MPRLPATARAAKNGASARDFIGRLVEPQVLVALPWMNGAPVAFVLFELRIAKRVVEMIAEGRAHDRVAVELGNRLAQRFRQRANAAFAAVFLGQIVSRSD